jgi:carbamoyltransferase
MENSYILGVSALYHDSAACILKNNEIIAAAQEERFTRIKQDPQFPFESIDFCLNRAGISFSQLQALVFYDKPLLKFERLMETYLAYSPRGIKSFTQAVPVWLKEKLWIPDTIKKRYNTTGNLYFTEHHESHAASAFFPSPFENAAFLTIDGVGEWATTAAGIGKNNKIDFFKTIKFPHSLGLLYAAFTYYTGFKVNSGEYKVMGLAPYGEPVFYDAIMDNLIDLKEDGSFRLNMEYFDYCTGSTMTSEKFNTLFNAPPRKAESKLTQREMDLAASIQAVTETIVVKIARHLYKETKLKNLCMAGGVALNCVANSKILNKTPFENLWIQPAAGDAGGALGAALFYWHQVLDKPRQAHGKKDSQKGSLLGPCWSNSAIKVFLDKHGLPYKEYPEQHSRAGMGTDTKIQDSPGMGTDAKIQDNPGMGIAEKIAVLINEGNIIGHYNGPMEFGPRALGNRSILGDALDKEMQKTMNLKIKFRESFRPFAPSVLYEKCPEWFDLEHAGPYMLLTAQVNENKKIKINENQKNLKGLDKLKVPRSLIPAVTHVNGSARLQTVHKDTNPRFHAIIDSFYNLTGCPVIINTSFNVRGEPIVCSPLDAYRCFMRTEIDYLVLGNFVLSKKEQAQTNDSISWEQDFNPD